MLSLKVRQIQKSSFNLLKNLLMKECMWKRAFQHTLALLKGSYALALLDAENSETSFM